jgi:hypothetical protein
MPLDSSIEATSTTVIETEPIAESKDGREHEQPSR